MCLLEEVYTVVEVYVHNEYHLSETNAKIIVDVGANIGISTIQLARRYPDAFIWAIEPSLDAIDRLKINIDLNKFSDRTQVVQAAVGGKDGSGILLVGSTSAVNSVSVSDCQEVPNTAEVPILSLASVLSMTSGPIDIMKLDCEGAEYPFFELSEIEDLKKIRYIVGEAHEFGSKTHNDMIMKFKEAGFDITWRNVNGIYGIFEARSTTCLE